MQITSLRWRGGGGGEWGGGGEEGVECGPAQQSGCPGVNNTSPSACVRACVRACMRACVRVCYSSQRQTCAVRRSYNPHRAPDENEAARVVRSRQVVKVTINADRYKQPSRR